MNNSSDSLKLPTVFKKPWLSFEDQVKLLKKRGLLFDSEFNDKKVEYLLSTVGYYRLSGYWYIFQNKSTCDNTDKSLDKNYFEPETTFRKVWNLYTFDEQLRLIVLRAISHLEIYMRTQLAYYLSEPDPSDKSKVMNAFGYEDNTNLPNLSPERHSDFIDKCTIQYNRSQTKFITHYKEKYDWNNYITLQQNSGKTTISEKPEGFHNLPPYWILANIMDFGMILTLYIGADRNIKEDISYNLRIPAFVLESWLKSLNTVRNICAHHDRLWNRRLNYKVSLPDANRPKKKYLEFKNEYKKWRGISNKTTFTILTILGFLEWSIYSNNEWHKQVRDLVDTLEPESLHRMGFPNKWKESPLWSEWLTK